MQVRSGVRLACVAAMAAAGCAGGLLAAATAQAAATDGCVAMSTLVTTCSYTTVGEHEIAVPAGTSALSVRLIGAAGGGGGRHGAGGSGAMVTGDLPITALAGASTLYAEVGGAGTADDNLTADGVGGYNGGGNGSGAGNVAPGGGGGGASDLRTAKAGAAGSTEQTDSLMSRVAVAAGGGGGSAVGDSGGNAGSNGGGNGGDAGTNTAGGDAGQGNRAGALGQGGLGTGNGGGGGGGLYGGGGGAGAGFGAGGGGGGGSSLTPQGGAQTLSGDPAEVIVTFTVAAVPPTVTTQPTDQTVTVGATATFTAAAAGTPDPTVKWQSAPAGSTTFSDITGATATSYTTPATADADNDVQFRAIFTNSAGNVITSAATLTVDVPPAFTTDTNLPAATVGQHYDTTIGKSGRPDPTTKVTAGALPPGLTLTGDPVLSGTPTRVGTYTFTVAATNTAGAASRTFHLTVHAAASSTPPSSTPPSSTAPSSTAPSTTTAAPEPSRSSGATTASTGVDVRDLGGAALIALGLGGAMLLSVRRRRLPRHRR